jgi:catechol 2,3-dioxygenase-like lactoylglutathione lyase family enzyme
MQIVLGDFPIQANIPVTDVDTARDFYSDVLGLVLADEMPGESLHYRCGSETWLEVFRTRAGVGSGHTEAGFLVTGIEDLVAGLRDRGVEFQDVDMGAGMATVDGILSFGDSKAAWLVDPDGNVIGLFQGGGSS